MTRIGYAYVVADILHIGHLKHLQACKGLCDKLIVGVLTDGATMEKKPKPVISFGERLEIIKNIKFVDAAIKQETYSPIDNLLRLRPDIHFESTSHAPEDIAKTESVMGQIGGRVIVMPYFAGQSSTDIKEKIVKVFRQGGDLNEKQ